MTTIPSPEARTQIGNLFRNLAEYAHAFEQLEQACDYWKAQTEELRRQPHRLPARLENVVVVSHSSSFAPDDTNALEMTSLEIEIAEHSRTPSTRLSFHPTAFRDLRTAVCDRELSEIKALTAQVLKEKYPTAVAAVASIVGSVKYLRTRLDEADNRLLDSMSGEQVQALKFQHGTEMVRLQKERNDIGADLGCALRRADWLEAELSKARTERAGEVVSLENRLVEAQRANDLLRDLLNRERTKSAPAERDAIDVG